MEVDPEDHELKDALCEIRKAYRLIVVYQRRIMDMAKKINQGFGFKPFFQVNFKYNATGSKKPTDRPSIDMLPLYSGYCMLFLPQKGGVYDHKNPKRSEYMLEIIFDNDTGFRNVYGEEPDPVSFADPGECETKLWLYVYGVTEDMKDTNWDTNVRQKLDWPKDGEHILNEKLWAAGKSYDLSVIQDESALKMVIEDFKKFVNLKRQEIGVC